MIVYDLFRKCFSLCLKKVFPCPDHDMVMYVGVNAISLVYCPIPGPSTRISKSPCHLAYPLLHPKLLLRSVSIVILS